MAVAKKARRKAVKKTIATAVKSSPQSAKIQPTVEPPLTPRAAAGTAKKGNSWIMIGLIAVMVLVIGEVAWMSKNKTSRQRTLTTVYEFGKRGQDIKDPQVYHGVTNFKMDKDKRVYILDPDFQRITVWDSVSKAYVMTIDKTTVQDAKFAPQDLTIDKQKNIYIVDSVQQKMFIVSTDGKLLGTWPAPALSSVTVDSQGNILAIDREKRKIEKYSPQGKILQTFGEPGAGNDKFGGPYRISVDAQDNCYVLDNAKKRILKFSSKGKFDRSWELEFVPDNLSNIFAGGDKVYVSNFGGYMIYAYSAKGKLLLEIKRDWPIGLAVDDEGFFYLPSAVQGVAKQELSEP